jgi:hypothetical protein
MSTKDCPAPQPVDFNFAVAMRAGMAIREVSLRGLSSQTGIPTWRLSDIKAGRVSPRVEEVAVIWNALSS